MLLFGVRLVSWDSTWLTECRYHLPLKLIFQRRENKMPQVAMGLSVSWPLFGAISSSSVPQSPHPPTAWPWNAHCYCIAIQTALHLRWQFTVKANILPSWCLPCFPYACQFADHWMLEARRANSIKYLRLSLVGHLCALDTCALWPSKAHHSRKKHFVSA